MVRDDELGLNWLINRFVSEVGHSHAKVDVVLYIHPCTYTLHT